MAVACVNSLGTTNPGTKPSPSTRPTPRPTSKQETLGQEELEPGMLAAYAPLFERNPDLFGWIKIENTKLNYPVMYTPDDPEYYLRRAFDSSNSMSGVPFLDGRCFEGCGNYLIYGHHMKNGTMFAPITSYVKEEFWQKHPVIRFDTLYETGTYEAAYDDQLLTLSTCEYHTADGRFVVVARRVAAI